MEELLLSPKEEVAKITQFLKNTISHTPMNKIVIGLSGGIDSSVCAVLALGAVGKDHLYAVTLPYGDVTKDALPRIKQLTTQLSLDPSHLLNIDITSPVDSLLENNAVDQVRKGNIIARTRMIILYDLSKKYKALVCGTENKTEYLLGYFTRFGDEASDIEPIRHLYKTQVRQLAHFLNLPPEIIATPPTAGLWENQTDEGDFGFSYTNADKIIYYTFDQKKSKDEIMKMGISPQIIERVMKRVRENAFKRHLPYQLD